MEKANKYEDFLSDEEIMEIYHYNRKEGVALMIEKYTDYIYHVINKYYPSFSKETPEMFQHGVIGIMSAMPGYNPEKGCFTTYSTPFIKKEISNHVRFLAGESSEYFASVHNSVERAKAKIEAEGRVVNVENVMIETGLSKKITKREMKIDRTKVSYEVLSEVGVGMNLPQQFLVEDMLSSLPESTKEIIKMKVVERLPFTTIAKTKKTTVFSVKKEYDNGIAMLKKNMA